VSTGDGSSALLVASDGVSLLADSWRTLLEMRARSDRTWMIIPRSPEISDDCLRVTYGTLYSNAIRAACALLASGGSDGGPVVLSLDNGPSFCYAYFGVVLGGMVPIPFPSPGFSLQRSEYSSRLRAVIGHSGARYVITSSAVAERCRSDLAGREVSVLAIEDLVERPMSPRTLPSATPLDSIGLIQYTSGTTGQPRAVVLSHRSVLHNVAGLVHRMDLQEDRDVSLCWLPMFHDMGLVGTMLTATYAGLPQVVLTPRSFIMRPESWLWAISKFGVTACAGPNFAYQLLASRSDKKPPRHLNLRRWRVAVNGAERVQSTTIDAFADAFACAGYDPSAMTPAYGLAENAVACTMARSGVKLVREMDSAMHPQLDRELLESNAISVGTPLWGQSVRVVDQCGAVARAGAEGEVEVSGPSVMEGYLGDSEATGRSISLDGWLRTGDRGVIAGGELFILGRKKDVIKRAGRSFDGGQLAAEIVAALPVAARVAAFGVPNARTGTEDLIVMVGVERGAGSTVDDRKVLSRAVQGVVGFLPDDVVLVASRQIPVTSSGKVQIERVRSQYMAMRALAPVSCASADECISAPSDSK
jgi:acyl-CoA synthetase (AMP-forming)/AMP-acid ligase II